MADKTNPFAGVEFMPLAPGVSGATVDGNVYLRVSTDAKHGNLTGSGATLMTASSPWVQIPGVARLDNGADFRLQVNAGYRVPKSARG